MSLATEILNRRAELEAQITGGLRSMPFALPEMDAAQFMPLPSGLFNLLFIKQAEQSVVIVPIPHMFDAPEGEEDKLAAYRAAFSPCFTDLPLEGLVSLLMSLEEAVEDIKFQAQFQVLLEGGGIQESSMMCEPGYDKTKKGYLLANWNHIDQPLQDWLEAQDYSLEWSDEWTTCDDCGGLMRTTHNSYGWKMYGRINEDGATCGDCLKKDLPAYLEELEGKSRAALMLDVDPTQHGYILVNHSERDRFQNGWHPGQTDDPTAMSKALRLAGIKRFLWRVPSVGQFDVDFLLYLHEDEKDTLKDARAAVGLTEK